MVNFVGLSELELISTEERHVRAIVERHMVRIHTLADDVVDARIRIKRMHKRGGASRYEVAISLLTGNAATHAMSSSWTLAIAVHHAFESIESQLIGRRGVERREGGHTDVWNYSNPVV